MEWSKLLTNLRFRQGQPLKDFDGRNQFENDYSRLISSPFIRRLQDKTQVFPLHESDFIRTRLTHSLEVSSIGKSIGRSVEKLLLQEGLMLETEKELLPSLLCTAGLIHDLGNPPYGHFGEAAIQKFFTEYFKKNDRSLSPQECMDLQYFDGNVQTFRILRKLQYMGDFNGYNLTFPTLASIIKYPVDSLEGNKGDKTTDIHKKKFGYFITEESDYDQISEELQLNNRRHPATFLLEAADDIAYSAADIEDGIKLGMLDYSIIYETFESLIPEPILRNEVLNTLEKYRKDFAIHKEQKLNLIVTRFRIYTQAKMIQSVIQAFMKNYEVIMNGTFSEELIKVSDTYAIRKGFKALSKIVFKNSNVLQAELSGYEIIKGLLEKFVTASMSEDFHTDGKHLEGRLFNMIASGLRFIYDSNPTNHPNREYLKLQLIVDFISGMTDSYAINYYKKINGLSY